MFHITVQSMTRPERIVQQKAETARLLGLWLRAFESNDWRVLHVRKQVMMVGEKQ